MNRHNNFDLLRLFAACQVLSMHAGEWLKLPLGGAGYYLLLFPGVPIFFVVSGFLIPASFVTSASTPQYFLKRALRIYPAMWVNLCVIIPMMLAAGVFHDPVLSFAWLVIVAVTASTVFAQITGSAQVVWNANLPFFPGGVLWTITIELGFYILVPILFARRIKARSWTLWTVISMAAMISLAAQIYLQHNPGGIRVLWTAIPPPLWMFLHRVLWTTIPPYLWMFLIGTAVWLAWDRIRLAFEGLGPVWLTAYLAYSIWSHQTPDFQNLTPLNVIQIVILAGTVISCAHTLPRLSSLLAGQDISYGIYLYHMPVVMLFMAAGWTSHAYLWPVVYALVAIAATASWLLIEQPSLGMKSTLLKRRKTETQLASP